MGIWEQSQNIVGSKGTCKLGNKGTWYVKYLWGREQRKKEHTPSPTPSLGNHHEIHSVENQLDCIWVQSNTSIPLWNQNQEPKLSPNPARLPSFLGTPRGYIIICHSVSDRAWCHFINWRTKGKRLNLQGNTSTSPVKLQEPTNFCFSSLLSLACMAFGKTIVL
jgi:hypothetical protein